MKFSRTSRISEEIKKELGSIIQHELKDPRLPDFTSVVSVSVSKDLRHAKIRISVLGDETQKKNAIEGLTSASGFVRKELGRRIKIRYIPELHFELDNSIEHGVYISRLINEVVKNENPEETTEN